MSQVNTDPRTVWGLDDEWERFDQFQLNKKELQALLKKYVGVLPWANLRKIPLASVWECKAMGL